MKKLKMYCLTLNDNHLNKIKKLNYIPVGLGKDILSNEFLRDNTGDNISGKNPFYGEYTFHYWIWKNELIHFDNSWIGFCQYRKHWSKNKTEVKIENISDLNNHILKNIPEDFKNYECILGERIFINQFRFSKFIKKNLKTMILNPKLFLSKKKRNIKFHFDMMHGRGNLNKAIGLLDHNDREDFNYFVNTEVSFNPHNMFICNSKKILFQYYDVIFPWLERCEKVFGFNLSGYDMQRIYGFLAERFMSFWFKKNTKFKTMPIIFKDITNLN